MGGQGRVRTVERVVERGGTITARALAEVHPAVRGLTVSQYRVLVLIANAPDGVHVGELARRSSSRPSATSKIVGRRRQRHRDLNRRPGGSAGEVQPPSEVGSDAPADGAHRQR